MTSIKTTYSAKTTCTKAPGDKTWPLHRMLHTVFHRGNDRVALRRSSTDIEKEKLAALATPARTTTSPMQNVPAEPLPASTTVPIPVVPAKSSENVPRGLRSRISHHMARSSARHAVRKEIRKTFVSSIVRRDHINA